MGLEKCNTEFRKVNKALRVYVNTFDKSSTDDLTISNFFENKMLVIHSIRRGLSYRLFDSIKEITPFTEEDWADYLDLSLRTLQRHKNENKYHFKSIHSEKILELAEVTNFGKEVFNSKEKFYEWLNLPSFALGNLQPSELLKDSYGKELVMAELNRIDQGIFV